MPLQKMSTDPRDQGVARRTAGVVTPIPGGGYRLPGAGPRPNAPARQPPPEETAEQQAEQLAQGGTSEIKTAANPYQTEAFGDVRKYAESLADRSHESITNAMQRERDVGSGNLAEVAAAAGRRGAAPGSGLAGVLAQREGARTAQQVAKTNAALTDVALGREAQARAIEMGGATDIARDQTDMFGKQADYYLGGRRADLDRADFYARERNERFDRAAEIADMALDEEPRGYDYGPGGGTGSGRGWTGGGLGKRTILGGPASSRSTYSDVWAGHPYAGGK